MGNIVSAASAFRLSKSYLPAHSTFYNAVSISLRSFADAARMWCAEAKHKGDMIALCGSDAARMWCAEAKCFATEARDLVLEMQPVCGVLRQR